MAILFLIRHGENDLVGKRLAGRLPGVHLNEKGKQQAEILGQILSARKLSALYSSPLERAVETAQPLAEALKFSVITDDSLQEVDYGTWQGENLSHLKRLKLWKVVQETPSRMRFPGGESLLEAQRRITAGIDLITAAYKDHEEAACFSHCDSIRLALIHYLGMDLDSLHRIVVDPASISIIRLVKGEKPKILGINLVQIGCL